MSNIINPLGLERKEGLDIMDEFEADYQFFTKLVSTFVPTTQEPAELQKDTAANSTASLSELRARLQAQLDRSKAKRMAKGKQAVAS